MTTTNDMPNVSSFYVVETELTAVSREAGEKACDISTVPSTTNREEDDAPTTTVRSETLISEQTPSSAENARQPANSVGHKPRNKKAEVNGRANRPNGNIEATITNDETVAETRSDAPTDHHEVSSRTDTVEGDDSTCANTKHKPLKSNDNNADSKLLNNHVEESLINGDSNLERLNDPTEQKANVSNSIRESRTDAALPKKTRPTSAASVGSTQTTNANGTENGAPRLQRRCNNSSVARTTSSSSSSLVQPKKKKSKKGPKFVREPTPGPDLENQTTRSSDMENGKVVRQLEAVELSDDARTTIQQIADRDAANDKHDEETSETKVGNENREISRVGEENSTPLEIRNSDDGQTKTTTHQDTMAGSNEDSGFESQTRLSDYPITNAVTEWLRRANSPDVFLTSASTSNSEEEEDDEDMDAGPPKNLQGNPMPALSANSGVDNGITTVLSRTTSCGEFAKTNNNNSKNNNNNIKIIDRMETNGVSTIGRHKRDAIGTMRKKATTKKIVKRNGRNVDEKAQCQLVSSLVSCRHLENLVAAVRLRSPKSSNNVGDVCEFTEEDSVAGMRVALSSRMNSKRVSARRTKTSMRRIDGGDPVENINIRMRRIDDASGKSHGETINDNSTVSVRTFEKGEIIVSEDGKLLPTSSYEPVPSNDRDVSGMTKIRAITDIINKSERIEEVIRNDDDGGSSGNSSSSSSENNENNENVMMSSVSIEEPDVLECWEAETIEPVISPRRMLQSTGVLCEGEAAEEDNCEIENATVEHVRKYYRLQAPDSAVSIESGDSCELSIHPAVTTSESRTVPKNSEITIEKIDLCSIENIPIVMPDKSRDIILADEKIPIDEAFEVYESCYNSDGKSPFLASFDSKLFKQQQRPLYGQNGEGPIPCRAVCCNLQ